MGSAKGWESQQPVQFALPSDGVVDPGIEQFAEGKEVRIEGAMNAISADIQMAYQNGVSMKQPSLRRGTTRQSSTVHQRVRLTPRGLDS